MSTAAPITLALVNDYEVVVAGLARMLEPYADRVRVVEQDAARPVEASVDVALYDTFAQPLGSGLDHEELRSRHQAGKLVVYSWQDDPEVVRTLCEEGVNGFVSKQSTADELVAAVERVHAGEQLLPVECTEETPASGSDWPGREEGLTARESEVVALIVQGLSNVEVAARAYLSVNTIKSYIRSAYRKMGVQSRSQAVLWGIDHGFRGPVTGRGDEG